MWIENTKHLIEILRNLSGNTFHRLPDLTSISGETKFSYKYDSGSNSIRFEYEWDRQPEGTPVYVSGVSVGSTMTGSPSITPVHGVHQHMMQPLNTINAIPIKKVTIVTDVNRNEILSLRWEELATQGQAQYVYSVNTVSGNYVLKESDSIMFAIPLRHGKVLINNTIFDLEESPDAFLKDLSGEEKFSPLNVIEIINEYKGP